MDNQNPLPEEQITPPASPSDADLNAQTPQEEEQEGKRSAEARINELLSKNKELLDEMRGLRERVEAIPVPAPIVPRPQEENPDVQKAVNLIKETGQLVNKNELEERIRGIQDRMTLDSEHQILERTYDGSDGRPKYDRAKTEERMRRFGGMPEDSYKLLHEAELLDWTIKQAETERKKKPFIAKPASTAGIREDGTITREKIATALKTPEGRAWYEQHRKEILSLYGEGKL